MAESIDKDRLQVCRLLSTVAMNLYQEAAARHGAKKMSDDEFKAFYGDVYVVLKTYSMDLAALSAVRSAQAIAEALPAVKAATKELNLTQSRIKKIEDIVAFGAAVVVAGAAVAAFIAAPTASVAGASAKQVAAAVSAAKKLV